MYAVLPMYSIAEVAQSGTEIIWEIQLVRVFRDALQSIRAKVFSIIIPYVAQK